MSEGASGNRAGPGTHMLRGSAWMISLRWAMRLTGVVSTVILARFLTPEDFGIVAIAMLVVGMFEMLSETGQTLALIRHPDPTREHYDTAWTISVLIGFGIGAGIFLIAPLTKFYFHDPRSVIVMQCLSLRAILSGLENIGIVSFKRDLQFNRFFWYNLYSKIFSFCVTVTLAVLLRNFWALVAGILCGQLARTALSYGMHSFRPRFSLSKAPEIWAFSIWILVRSIGNYFATQVDSIAVGGATGTTSMGRYTVAKDVAESPTYEIVTPIVAVLFPVMSRYQNDPAQLRQLYLRVLGWSLVIGVSSGLGIWLVAQDMVPLILGPKWTSVTPLVEWLALEAAITTMNTGAYPILDASGLPHLGARLQWLRVIVLATTMFPTVYLTHDLITLVVVRLFVMAALTIPVLIVAGRCAGVTLRDYVAAFWRPMAAGLAMVLAVLSANDLIGIAGPLRLGLDIVLGVVVYIGSLLALWSASGRPASVERDVVELIERGQTMLAAIRARVPNTAQ